MGGQTLADGWWDIGGDFTGTSGMAATSWSPGRLDLLGRGADGHVWHRVWLDPQGWQAPWTAIGAPVGGVAAGARVSAVASRPGRLDIVVIGHDRQCWLRSWDDAAGGWRSADFQPVGGVFEGTNVVHASVRAPGIVDIVAMTGGEAWHLELPTTLGAAPGQWHRLSGGPFAAGSELAATSWADGRLDVVGIAPHGEALLWSWDTIAGETPFRSIGGNFSGASRLAVSSWEPGRLDFFGVGADRRMWHRGWQEQSGWSGEWTAIGGAFASGVASAIGVRSDEVVVLGLAVDEGGQACWAKSYSSQSGWSPSGDGWTYLGGRFPADQSTTLVQFGDRVDVVGAATTCWHRPGLEPAPGAVLRSEQIVEAKSGRNLIEISTAALAPQADGGWLVVSAHDGMRPYLRVPLGSSGTFQDVDQPNGDLNPSPDLRPAYPGAFPAWGGDPWMTRLRNGALLHSRQAAFWSDVPADKQPAWWAGAGSVTDGKLPPNARVGPLFFASSDRGVTWQRRSMIDPVLIREQDGTIGFFGHHQNDSSGRAIPGGCDRNVVYADPWSDNVIWAANWTAGDIENIVRRTQWMLFISEDGARTWRGADGYSSPVHVEDYVFGPDMTSLPDGTLWVTGPLGDQIMLWRLQRSPSGWSVDRQPANFGTGTAERHHFYCWGKAASANDPRQLSYSDQRAISRVLAGQGGVRVAYSCESLTHPGRMGIAVTCFMQTAGGLQRHDLTIIDPSADGDCLYPTFVQTDFPGDSLSDTAVLYWIESAGTQLRARFSVFVGVETWTYPSDLSTGSWTVASARDVGDYMRGAFFRDGGLEFVPCWPQRNPSTGRIEVHYRMVSALAAQSVRTPP